MTPTQEARIREALEAAQKGLRPFVQLADERDARYRQRGGRLEGFPDKHPAYDVSAERLTMGAWRDARSALHAVGAALSDLEKQSSGQPNPPGDTLEDNVRYLLDQCPFTVRDRSGDRTGVRGREDLAGSLAITFLKMQGIAEKASGHSVREMHPALLAAVGTVSPVTPRSDEKDVLAGVDPSVKGEGDA